MGPVGGTVAAWAAELAAAVEHNTTAFLMQLADRIHHDFQHVGRFEGEPMAPEETLAGRNGACRDTAMLFVAACRSQGLAARYVSGYSIHHPPEVSEHELHAWAEVYLPGAGWRGYDPSLGLAVADERTEPIKDEPIRMVFLVSPGPGGGGGGGGLMQKAPPPKAMRKGVEKVSSPLPARQLPPPMRPTPRPPEPPPPPLEAKALPPVMAPIVNKPADAETREGVLAKAPEAPPSQGPSTGGGAGTGRGTGLGEGDGSGIGDGSGGGTGGGPYRPGSGVEPPRLLREVKANYTDDARRANIAGEVELEIVVRRDGTVGDVKVLRGLRGGLSERAVEAVKQWRFAAGRMKGVPVDVVVQVGVEFKLR